ncbi:MAG: hypothetical protein R6X06_11150 [Gammaproteobacteria bacterium]
MRHRHTRLWRPLWWAAAALILAATVFLLYLLVPLIPDPSTDFVARKSQLTTIEITREWQTEASKLAEISLRSDTGINVELTLRVPREASGPLPVAVLLGGYRTGRDAVHLLPETPGVIVAALSYPHNQPAAGPLKRLAVLQQAILDTPPATLLALDYLFTQPFVDTQRLELAGISLGAFFILPPAVLDERVKRVWLIHGAAKTGDIFRHQLQTYLTLAPLRWLAGHGLAALSYGHHLSPEKWAGRMSPRPVMVINTRQDPAFPQSSINALHQSLQPPNEIIWTTGPHVTPAQQKVIAQLTTLVMDRIAQGR